MLVYCPTNRVFNRQRLSCILQVVHICTFTFTFKSHHLHLTVVHIYRTVPQGEVSFPRCLSLSAVRRMVVASLSCVLVLPASTSSPSHILHIDRIASQGGMPFLLDQAFPGGPSSKTNLHLHHIRTLEPPTPHTLAKVQSGQGSDGWVVLTVNIWIMSGFILGEINIV